MSTARTVTSRRTPRRARHAARLAGSTAVVVALALATPASAAPGVAPGAAPEGDGNEVIFDGTQESFDAWEYAGDGGFDLLDDGTIRSRVGEDGGFGTLWYPVRQYGDFSLTLEFRDDAPGDLRGNSGVQVRFPALSGPVEGCPTTFNGNETGNLSWIAVNCGHEIQVNDSPEGGSNDPRKTGSVYGFADIGLDRAMPTPKGTWNELEVRVVGQHYTVIRNGVVINEYENLPGVPFPGRPLDPDSSSRGLVGYVGVQAHGSAPDVVSYRDIRVRELPPVTTQADVRCLAGTAYVAVRAENVGDTPVDVTLTTPTGERTFTDVAPQRSAYQSFSTRAASVAAGSVTLTVAGDDGGHVTVETPYAAADCG
ncbi:3-keto-disaccharide hydrolase [Cellulosimicrobium sp. Marseille-Q8652]